MKTETIYRVAKAAWRGKMPAMRLLALILPAIVLTVSAQQPEGDRPPPGEGAPHRADGERRGPPGGPGMMPGKGRQHFSGFEKLSEEERTKVRAAFEKAWKRPEVIESRDKAMQANEEMRERLRKAVQEIDPEVAKILEKVKPPFPMDQKGLPEMPKPDSPEFARMAGVRLGAEMMAMSRPERRDDTRRFHERIMQMPRVKEALAKLEQLPPAERMAGFKKLRDVYREITGEEFRKAREKSAESKEGREGFRRPPADGAAAEKN